MDCLDGNGWTALQARPAIDTHTEAHSSCSVYGQAVVTPTVGVIWLHLCALLIADPRALGSRDSGPQAIVHAQDHLPCRSLGSTLSSVKQKASYSGEELGTMLEMLSLSSSRHHGLLPPRMEQGCRPLRASECGAPASELPPKLCWEHLRRLPAAIKTKVCMLELVVQDWWTMHCRAFGLLVLDFPV